MRLILIALLAVSAVQGQYFFLDILGEMTIEHYCPKLELWGEKCQYRAAHRNLCHNPGLYLACYCGGCKEYNAEPDGHCCTYCVRDVHCDCDEHCVKNERWCIHCPDGKVDMDKGVKALYYDVKYTDLIVKTEETYMERGEARGGCKKMGRELLYIDSPEKKSEAVGYINQNFPSPRATVIWLEGYFSQGHVHDYNDISMASRPGFRVCPVFTNYGKATDLTYQGITCRATRSAKHGLCIRGDAEFFNLANRDEVLVSDGEFDNREDAEKYCVNNDRELAYMEIPKAYQELVRYLNRYYRDIPDAWLWVDGTRDKQEKLTGNDWKVSRDRKGKWCMYLNKQGGDWIPRSFPCVTEGHYKLKAVCAKRTYKYKLIVKESKSGITHAENGEYCNGLGLMMVPTGFQQADIERLGAELNRLKLTGSMWLSGIFAQKNGKNVIRIGDTVKADMNRWYPYLTIDEDEGSRKLRVWECGSRIKNKIYLCYDEPASEPRYSILSATSEES